MVQVLVLGHFDTLAWIKITSEKCRAKNVSRKKNIVHPAGIE
jgi:hypothetical protein